jgi:hypothetical protein
VRRKRSRCSLPCSPHGKCSSRQVAGPVAWDTMPWHAMLRDTMLRRNASAPLRPLRCIEPSAAFGGCAQPMVHRTIKGESHSTGRRCAWIRRAAPTRGPRWILCLRCLCTAVRWGHAGHRFCENRRAAAPSTYTVDRIRLQRRAVFAKTQWLTVPRLSRWTQPASRASSSSRRITTVTPQF